MGLDLSLLLRWVPKNILLPHFASANKQVNFYLGLRLFLIPKMNLKNKIKGLITTAAKDR